MNKALVLNTVQRLMSRPMALLVMAAYGIYVLISILARATNPTMDLDPVGSSKAAWFLTWILGSGVLGGDQRDGTLPLLLSRPVSRARYVLSRWAGLVLSVVAIDVVLHLAALLYHYSSHDFFGPGPWLVRELWFIYFVLLSASWIALLSALFSGHGDLLYFIGASVAISFLGGKFAGNEAALKAIGALTWLWKPGEASFLAWRAQDPWGAAYSALIFVAGSGVCLAAAAYVLQRRDISYVNR